MISDQKRPGHTPYYHCRHTIFHVDLHLKLTWDLYLKLTRIEGWITAVLIVFFQSVCLPVVFKTCMDYRHR